MSESPSKRRRKGREAFTPNTNPMELQPYKEGTWNYTCHLQDWLDGWDEAEKQANTPTPIKKCLGNVDYLGDGVYSIYDGFGIWLHTNDHKHPTDRIYIEPSVLEALNRFVKRMEGDK